MDAPFAIIFVLVILTYLNHRKAVLTWIEQIDVCQNASMDFQRQVCFFSLEGLGWFELIYISVGVAVFYLLTIHFGTYLSANQQLDGEGTAALYRFYVVDHCV